MDKVVVGGKPHSRVMVLDTPVDAVNMFEALDLIESFLSEPRPHTVITLNSTGALLARRDPAWRSLLLTASLVTADGAGVVWAMRRRGAVMHGRVTGVDLVLQMAELSADRGYRIYLLGGEPGVAERTADKLTLSYPGCHIVGYRHGYFPPESDALVAAEVAETKPDILLVAMGQPRQEQFLAAHGATIGFRVGIGVGGSFDVVSGKVRRAPALFRRLSLEWLYRMFQDRKKFKRFLDLPRFVAAVLMDRK
ncbi:MAG: WecB/TagA/CpsF family glycosyltransferase [Fimbriimonadaceae bacterium]